MEYARVAFGKTLSLKRSSNSSDAEYDQRLNIEEKKSVGRKMTRSLATASTRSLRKVSEILSGWLRSQIYEQSQSIFDLVSRVQKETDQISFRRQVMMDKVRRSRSPVGF